MMTYEDKRPYISATIKRQIMTECGHKCSVNRCHDRTVEIHHIDQNRENNDLYNLIVLCRNHHKQAHDGFITRRDLKQYKTMLLTNEVSTQSPRLNDHDCNVLGQISQLFPYDLILQIQSELFGSRVARVIIDAIDTYINISKDPLFSFNSRRLEDLKNEATATAILFNGHFSQQCVGYDEYYYRYIDINEFEQRRSNIDLSYWRKYSRDTQDLAYDFCKIILILRGELKHC